MKKNLPKITLSEVNQKRLKIACYLLASGLLGYILAIVAKDPALTVVFTPVINFILYSVTEELKGEGYIKVLKK